MVRLLIVVVVVFGIVVFGLCVLGGGGAGVGGCALTTMVKAMESPTKTPFLTSLTTTAPARLCTRTGPKVTGPDGPKVLIRTLFFESAVTTMLMQPLASACPRPRSFPPTETFTRCSGVKPQTHVVRDE